MIRKATGKRRPTARVARKREQVRQEILAAAREILRQDGVEGVTLASVAARLGMTKPALYHYFPSKEALVQGLVVTLLDDEIETLIAAVEKSATRTDILGTLIRTFYAHYRDRLYALRTVYCRSQLGAAGQIGLDQDTIREQINPRTRHLFDVLETRIAGAGASAAERRRARQLAYCAWLSALGMLTMLGVAEANQDPLVHSDKDLLKVLSGVYSIEA